MAEDSASTHTVSTTGTAIGNHASHEGEKYISTFEVKWEEGDKENPYNWSPAKRWYLVIMASMLVVNAGFASTACSQSLPKYQEIFGISEVLAVLSITIFVAGYAAGPLVWGPMSEMFGRRKVMLASLGPYIGWCIGGALSKNYASVLVFRFLAGTFGAAPLSNSGATIADVLPPASLGIGMSFYSLAPFAGPVLGPAVSGFIAARGASWRWVYWTLAIFSGLLYSVCIATFPETSGPLLLKQRAIRMRKETGDNRYWAPLEKKKRSLKDLFLACAVKPWVMLVEEPMLLAVTLYMSYVYGIVYTLFSVIPLIFAGVHGFGPGVTGLSYIPIAIGGLTCQLIYIYYYQPKYIKKMAAYSPERVPPEERMRQAMPAAIIFPISLLMLGWTGHYASVSYWAPLIALGLFGLSVLMVFLPIVSYIVDTYLANAATALAINTIVRSIVATGLPLAAPAMFGNLGINWACTLLGCIALLGMPIPFILFRYGDRIRAMSKNAPKTAPPKSLSVEEVEKANKEVASEA